MVTERSPQSAATFAAHWIDAWNRHDLEAILSHYAEDVVFLSPVAHRRLGDGRVVGIEALRHYWGLGLASQPDLRFELTSVQVGHRCLTLQYRNHRGQSVAETLEFDDAGKVVRGYACYG